MAGAVEKLLAEGRAFEKKGKHERALELYRKATGIDPIDPEAWEARGEAAARLGHKPEAADAFFRVADMYARAGMPMEATRIVQRVLQIDPAHAGAKRFARMLESRSGQREAVPEPAPEPVATPEAPGPATPAPRAASEAEPEVVEMEAEEPEFEPSPTGPRPKAPASASMPPPLRAAAAVVVGPAGGSGSIGESLRQATEGDEFTLGRTTGELALEQTIALADHLPASDAGGHKEIHLDDEPQVDVLKAVASAIGSSPLLSELDSDLVRHLIDAGTLSRRAAGQDVFRQGDAGNSLYLILGGEVVVVHEASGESPRELARLRAGAFFGEMALITNQPRSATVRVAATADLLEVSRKAVRAMIEKNPRVLKLLMRFFRARLVGTLLQTSPVFESFAADDRRTLVAAFRLRELGPGHAVFEEGARSEGLFVLLAGRLEVVRGLSEVIGRLAPGDVFGEMSLLEGTPAMASVKAKTRAWVLLLPRDVFETMAERYPQIRGRLRALADTRKARNQQSVELGGRERRVEPV